MPQRQELVADGVRKCSRCRVKRVSEPIEQLNKYATCVNCRTKRRVVKAPIDTSMPNLYTEYMDFLNKIKLNTTSDVLDTRYRGITDPNVFKRYPVNTDLDPDTYQFIGKQLIHFYINPLMDATGFRFPVRDYHKGGRKTKKITFMFICSQDRSKQRVSRSNNKRQIHNRLKVEFCDSKLTLNYSLPDGVIQILYNHKTHAPYNSKRNERTDPQPTDTSSTPVNFAQNLDQQRYIQQAQQAVMNIVDAQNLAQYNQLQNLTRYNQQVNFSQPSSNQLPLPLMNPQQLAFVVQQQQAENEAQQQQHHQTESRESELHSQNQSSIQGSKSNGAEASQSTLKQGKPDDKEIDENIDKELIGLNR